MPNDDEIRFIEVEIGEQGSLGNALVHALCEGHAKRFAEAALLDFALWLCERGPNPRTVSAAHLIEAWASDLNELEDDEDEYF